MTGLKLTSNNYLMPLYVYQKWKRKSIFKVNITLLIFFFWSENNGSGITVSQNSYSEEGNSFRIYSVR